MRLRQQLDLLETREAEAIAVEESSIEQQELAESSEVANDALLFDQGIPGLHLGPETWNAMDGGFDLGSEFWEIPNHQEAGGTVGS